MATGAGWPPSWKLCELVFAKQFFLFGWLASISPVNAKTYDKQ